MFLQNKRKIFGQTFPLKWEPSIVLILDLFPSPEGGVESAKSGLRTALLIHFAALGKIFLEVTWRGRGKQ